MLRWPSMEVYGGATGLVTDVQDRFYVFTITIAHRTLEVP